MATQQMNIELGIWLGKMLTRLNGPSAGDEKFTVDELTLRDILVRFREREQWREIAVIHELWEANNDKAATT